MKKQKQNWCEWCGKNSTHTTDTHIYDAETNLYRIFDKEIPNRTVFIGTLKQCSTYVQKANADAQHEAFGIEEHEIKFKKFLTKE